MERRCDSKFCMIFRYFGAIALYEGDINSQLEWKKATDNVGSILCTLKHIIHFLQFLIFGCCVLPHVGPDQELLYTYEKLPLMSTWQLLSLRLLLAFYLITFIIVKKGFTEHRVGCFTQILYLIIHGDC